MPVARTLSPSAVRAARDIRVAVSRLRRQAVDLADTQELTPSQLSVLSRLGKDGPASASDLAAAERIRPQSVAATLAVLEERGFVTRKPDPADRRRQLISLTRNGKALFDDRRRHSEEWLGRALEDRLTESERQTVIEAAALLEKLTRP
jgi:DNA-binding MarR family transcriptional regulator